MKTEALKKAYWKVVMLITAFFCGSSAVFLLSGAGYPGLRVLVFVIFLVCLLNLSLYAREIVQGLKTAARLVGGQSAEPGGQGPPAKGGDKGGGKGEGPKPERKPDAEA